MTFNDDARISGRGVRRGRRTGLAVGGGGLGVLALALLSSYLGVDLTGLLGGGGAGGAQDPGVAVEDCQTGEDANNSIDCRIAGAYDSLEDYWSEQAPALGITYSTPEVYLFTGSVDTGCGNATSAVGPFYCPPDRQIYIDTAFYDDLRNRFGASGGPLAELYVVAHEWGHHIQTLAGISENIDQTDTGPTSDSVRLEVQADCFAGAWAGAAATTEDASGTPLLEEITDAQVRDALDAASAIGDDRIQEQTSGQVNPETWTHGSGEQRQKWFTTGYTDGAAACDTFAASASEL